MSLQQNFPPGSDPHPQVKENYSFPLGSVFSKICATRIREERVGTNDGTAIA